MSWVVVAIGSVVASSVYGADQNRKGLHAQQDALRAAESEDARQAAEAETAAQVAANAKTAEAKRRRRTSALGAGDPMALSETLGGAPSLLAGAVGPTGAARALRDAAGLASAYAGTALGAGASATRSAGGRVIVPTKPSRASAL